MIISLITLLDENNVIIHISFNYNLCTTKVILDGVSYYEGKTITICEQISTTCKSHHNYIAF